MKIAQIITSLNTGGAEKLVADSLPFFRQSGIDCEVISLKISDSYLFRQVRETGVLIALSKGSVYNPLLIFKLIPLLKKYDLVHVHLFPALYWVVLAKIFSFSKVKIVHTEHSTDNRRRSSLLFGMMDKIIYKRLSKVITISKKVDEKLKDHLPKNVSSQIQLIYNGVDLAKFKTAEAVNKRAFFTNEDYLLIQVSSFSTPKDQPTLIKSLNYLPEKIKLLLVGDGVLRNKCEDLVKQEKLSDRVKFLGIRSDIPNLLQMADVAVLSSHYEGLSLSSIEGMATNPFIASDVPGLKEIVSGYGLLFEEGNAKELSEQVLKLYNSPEFYREVAQKCAERASEFDIKRMVKEYVEVYEQVLEK